MNAREEGALSRQSSAVSDPVLSAAWGPGAGGGGGARAPQLPHQLGEAPEEAALGGKPLLGAIGGLWPALYAGSGVPGTAFKKIQKDFIQANGVGYARCLNMTMKKKFKTRGRGYPLPPGVTLGSILESTIFRCFALKKKTRPKWPKKSKKRPKKTGQKNGQNPVTGGGPRLVQRTQASCPPGSPTCIKKNPNHDVEILSRALVQQCVMYMSSCRLMTLTNMIIYTNLQLVVKKFNKFLFPPLLLNYYKLSLLLTAFGRSNSLRRGSKPHQVNTKTLNKYAGVCFYLSFQLFVWL